ncbi:MAG: hypothetical protein ACT4PU_09455 [Planctomycetota bacterium]
MADAEPDVVRRRGPLARLLRALLILLLLIVLVTAFLPTILSTAPFRNRLVEEANRQIGGTIELGELDISWFGAQRLTALTLWPGRIGEGEPLLELPEASFEASVLSLAAGRLALRCQLDGFKALLVVHPDGSTNLEEFLGLPPRPRGADAPPGSDPAPPPPGEPRGGARRPGLALPDDLLVDLTLRNGSAILRDEKKGVTTGVEKLTISAKNPGVGAPLVVRLSADLVTGDSRAPIELKAHGLGRRDRSVSLSFQGTGIQPGSLSAPLLAAAFPLLASSAQGQPVSVSAPLDLSVQLQSPSLDELMAKNYESLAGSARVAIGRGHIQGGLFGELQSAVQALQEGGEPLIDLSFGGFDGDVRIEAGRLAIGSAALARSDGTRRVLPIEGYASLDGTLHYRIPWAGLVGEKYASHFSGRALTIEGPWNGPAFALGLDGLVTDALKNELQQRLDEKLKEALGDTLDPAQGDAVEQAKAAAKEKAAEKLNELLKKKLGGKQP